MSKPQSWINCDASIKAHITSFTDLVKYSIDNNLVGIYLHGSLAMGSYFFPKSDIDIIIVVKEKLSVTDAEALNIEIAKYSDERPSIGDIELSVITADTAINAPDKVPYELHYSSMWRDRILCGKVTYGEQQYDSDLPAHLMCIKKRGVVLYGLQIDEVFGDVNWDAFMLAIFYDLDWILAEENICESPFYCILNLCRVMQLLTEKTNECYSKLEGGQWALSYLPERFRPLIQMALDIYSSDISVDEKHHQTGGVEWDNRALIEFRNYMKEKCSHPKDE